MRAMPSRRIMEGSSVWPSRDVADGRRMVRHRQAARRPKFRDDESGAPAKSTATQAKEVPVVALFVFIAGLLLRRLRSTS